MNLQPFLDISQSGDLPSFERRLLEFTHAFEFGIVNAIVVQEPTGGPALFTSIGNIPEGFVETFHDPVTSRRNPVLSRLKHSSMPLAYDQGLYVRDGAAALYEHQAMHGYCNGIAVAMHLRDNKHFLLGVDREEALPADVEHLTNLMAAVQLLAVHAQDAAFRLLLPQCTRHIPDLTPRELEVLRWTREGKSSWAVGEILAVSENTVNFHIRNALKKLDASSKHQAVLRAMTHGLL